MSESSLRKRRIVRRAVVVLAGVVLMMWGYVCSDLGVHWLYGRGAISGLTYVRLQMTIFWPVNLYVRERYPGGEIIQRACERRWSEGEDARARAMGR